MMWLFVCMAIVTFYIFLVPSNPIHKKKDKLLLTHTLIHTRRKSKKDEFSPLSCRMNNASRVGVSCQPV